MSDLVKRLRAKSADYREAKAPAWGDLMAEAADRIAALEAALIRAAMPIVEWENGIYVYHCVACDEHGKPDQLRHQLNHLSNCYLVAALKEGT
jgi:hypothetical protein